MDISDKMVESKCASVLIIKISFREKKRDKKDPFLHERGSLGRRLLA